MFFMYESDPTKEQIFDKSESKVGHPNKKKPVIKNVNVLSKI